MPALEGLTKTYDSEILNVSGVVLGEKDTARSENIMGKVNVDFLNLLDDGTFARVVQVVPQIFFINNRGEVIYGIIGQASQDTLEAVANILLE